VSDAAHMAVALALGRRNQGRTWPNPAVGCVIVTDGRVVGRGWTARGGRPHAETLALAQAGEAARGATAYVTLEPCSHHGATPPCAEALVQAGVARVVVACGDPDPRVNGRGIARLRAAGIAVTEGVLAGEAARDHRGFFLRVREGRPLVTLKLALSLDGRIATAAGESRWITGPEARRRVHLMRLTHDAVMIGAGTARADDPDLTVRGFGEVSQPARIVLSRDLDLPETGRLAAGPLWLVHGPDAAHERVARWRDRGTRLCAVTATGAGLDVAGALAALAGEGLTRVLCEGGGTLAASLLRGGLVDELVAFHAGLALGAEGRPGLGALPAGPLAAFPRLRLDRVEAVGADTMSAWTAATWP
jgi:diaminohydroxyphosphoribosylaminopyrimidine deaminase/5-amino-6-(5-phosphoribosylamino)uracil reductase